MGLGWWDDRCVAFTVRSRSSSEGTLDSAVVLVGTRRAAPDEHVANPSGEFSRSPSSERFGQGEQLSATSRPTMQAPPAVRRAETMKAVRADLEPDLRCGPQPDAPQQQRRGDRGGRVEEPSRDASRRDGADGFADDAPIAPQPDARSHRFCAKLGRAPQGPLSQTVAMQVKTALVMRCCPASGAVTRASRLDVRVVFRPRLDVERGVDQGQRCFGHS